MKLNMTVEVMKRLKKENIYINVKASTRGFTEELVRKKVNEARKLWITRVI